MPRFYQHLEPADEAGRVTTLKYVDDVNDDELTLYYFADGTKCSDEFIADWDNPEPYRGNALVLLAGPEYAWRIERREVVDEKSDKMVGADGITYEAPTPGTKLDGTGQNKTVVAGPKEGIRLEFNPPRRPKRVSIEPLEDFLLSLHPELEEGAVPALPKPERPSAPEPVRAPEPSRADEAVYEEVDDFDAALGGGAAEAVETKPVPAAEEPVPVRKSNELNLDAAAADFGTRDFSVLVTFGGKTTEVPAKDVAALVEERLSGKGVPGADLSEDAAEIRREEDPLVRNMIDKSKKKPCRVTMGITLELPPRAVYDTIASVYEDGMAEQFVRSLTARISQRQLLEALASGLSAYYSGSAPASAKNATGKSEE